MSRPLCVAAESPRPRRGPQPAFASGGNRQAARGFRRGAARHPCGHTHRRHAGGRAPVDGAPSAGHPHHHPGISLPSAHQRGAPHPRVGPLAHRRRDPFRRRHQAGLPPRAEPRAVVRDHESRAAAHRPVGDAAAAGGGRAISWRRRPRGVDRRRRPAQDDGGARRGPGRRHVPTFLGGGVGPHPQQHLARDLPAPARADPGASLDHRFRQLATPLGAPGGAHQRAGGRRSRTSAPRVDCARAAADHRRPAESRDPSRPRRHVDARARHRHGCGRPGAAGGSPAECRGRHPARRARRSFSGRGLEGSRDPEVPRRPAGGRGRRGGHARGTHRVDCRAAAGARRARAAGRGDVRDGRMEGRRAGRSGAASLSIQRARAPGIRVGAGHAQRPLSIGRVRRAETANRLGPHRGHRPRSRGCPEAGGHQPRHDPGSRPVHGEPGRRRTARGRARRGDGVREPCWRDVRARRLHLANRRDHPVPGAGYSCARRARQDRVLEGGRAQPPGRARPRPGQDGSRAQELGFGHGAETAARACGLRRPCGQEPARVSRRAGGRYWICARRSHGRRRALSRRDRRLARLFAHAARQSRARAAGAGSRGSPPGAPVGQRPRAVDRRRHRPPPS